MITRKTIDTIANELENTFGVGFRVELSSRDGGAYLRLLGLGRPHGFRIKISHGLASVAANIVFDSMAADLREKLQASSETLEASLLIAELRARYQELGISYVEQDDVALVGGIPAGCYLRFKQFPDVDSYILIVESLMSIILSVLNDSDEMDSNEANDDSFDEEGRASLLMSRRYERSRRNRALAIRFHGNTCCVCGFNFSRHFGPIGEGIIEIHHLTPVSMMGFSRIVNPRTELVPLCSNCHSMAHRKWPPYTPAELREALVISPDESLNG